MIFFSVVKFRIIETQKPPTRRQDSAVRLQPFKSACCSPHAGVSHLFPQTERRLRAESGPPAPAQASAIPFVDRYLEQHISPHALTSTVKINPLFPAQSSEDAEDGVKAQPSWTVEDYHAQTCGNRAEYLKVSAHADSGLKDFQWDVLPPEMRPAPNKPPAVSTGGTENCQRSGLLAGGRVHAGIRLAAEEDRSPAQEKKPAPILRPCCCVHQCCGDRGGDTCGASTEDQLTELVSRPPPALPDCSDGTLISSRVSKPPAERGAQTSA